MSPRRTLALLAALLLGGCSAYHLGTGPAAARDIEIRDIRNATQLPGAHAPLHQALVTAFSADRRFRVREGGEPLDAEIVTLERAAATQSSKDTLLAGQLRVTMTVRCTLRSADGRTQRFANRPFSATAILPTTGNLAGEERAVLPRLSAEIATKVRDAAAGAW